LRILGIIPSRFASTRLPGKPLINIDGKTMIQRVYEQCTQAKLLNNVVVATDCSYIFNSIKHINGNVIMTSSSHENGTSRCIEVVKKLEEVYDYVVNIQGDEPFIQAEQIDELCNFIIEHKIEIATQIKKEYNLALNQQANIVKCITNDNVNAINFTRAEVHLKDNYFFKHIGIYAFRKDILIEIEKLKPTENEMLNNLEQLRWLDNNINIKVQLTSYSSKSIDVMSDLN